MKHGLHVEKSRAFVKAKHPALYAANPATIDNLLKELHLWLDFFHNKKGDGYDYTGFNVIKHREQRHHLEGIEEIASQIAQKYGPEFLQIAREEAERHVIDDMRYVPFRDDYKRMGFWKNMCDDC
jgi:hypothetical protein